MPDVFGIFRQFKSLTAEEILKRTPNIASAHQDDLEESLGLKLVQFIKLFKTDVAAAIDNNKHEALELQFYNHFIWKKTFYMRNRHFKWKIHYSRVS